MTDGATPDSPRRFERIPRTERDESSTNIARAKLADRLEAIEAFLGHAVAGGRAGFTRNSPAYASGSMVVIRAAALFELREFDALLGDVPSDVIDAIRTIRNIAAHGGYRAMNDDVFWTTLTVHLPPHLEQWRASLGQAHARE